MFRVIVLAVVLCVEGIVYVSARRWLRQSWPDNRGIQILLAGLFLLFNGTLALLLVLHVRTTWLPSWFLYVATDPFYIWHGAVLILGFFLLLALILTLLFRLLRWLLHATPLIGRRLKAFERRPAIVQFDKSRRVFLRRSAYGLAAASFGSAAYGVYAEKDDVRFTRTHIAIPLLPPSMDGFTIAMASDIHSSPFMTKAEMDACVQALLSVDADVIVVPGDFVTSATEEVYPFAESFSALHAPSGVYGVMGNHDFFAADPDRVAREVNDCGIRLLHNERTLVTKGGGSIALVGIDDVGRPERASAYLRSALRGASPEVPSILLCHRPYFLPQAAEEGIDLVLSGHTHGGQIVFGRFGNVTLTPAQLFSPYVWGHYRHGAAQMFVSRGVGTVGLPMRINCPPEIVVITLSRSRVWQPRG
jgi:hypothetical protein